MGERNEAINIKEVRILNLVQRTAKNTKWNIVFGGFENNNKMYLQKQQESGMCWWWRLGRDCLEFGILFDGNPLCKKTGLLGYNYPAQKMNK